MWCSSLGCGVALNCYVRGDWARSTPFCVLITLKRRVGAHRGRNPLVTSKTSRDTTISIKTSWVLVLVMPGCLMLFEWTLPIFLNPYIIFYSPYFIFHLLYFSSLLSLAFNIILYSYLISYFYLRYSFFSFLFFFSLYLFQIAQQGCAAKAYFYCPTMN